MEVPGAVAGRLRIDHGPCLIGNCLQRSQEELLWPIVEGNLLAVELTSGEAKGVIDALRGHNDEPRSKPCGPLGSPEVQLVDVVVPRHGAEVGRQVGVEDLALSKDGADGWLCVGGNQGDLILIGDRLPEHPPLNMGRASKLAGLSLPHPDRETSVLHLGDEPLSH